MSSLPALARSIQLKGSTLAAEQVEHIRFQHRAKSWRVRS